MQIRIHTSIRKAMAFGASVILLGAYIYLASRAYMAYRASTVTERSSLEEAVRLQPLNAAYHDRLAQYYFFVDQNTHAALENYKAAVSLNPADAHCWLSLAMACVVTGDAPMQRKALEHAIAADPTTPDTAWQAANVYLVQGDLTRALQLFRIVLQYDDNQANAAILASWRAVGDPNRMMNEALPPRADCYVTFLQLLVREKNVAAAQQVWSRLVALRQTFSAESVLPYVQLLIDQNDGRDADKAWRQLAALDPHFRVYGADENLVVNGDFEHDILDGGFGWRYAPRPHVRLSIEKDATRDGKRALSLAFDLGARGVGVSHVIAVNPNTRYRFSAAYRTDHLVSASGPRFVFLDGTDNTQIMATDEMLAPDSWHEVEGSFMTSPSTSLVIMKIARQPDDVLIRGRLIVDDVRLEEVP